MPFFGHTLQNFALRLPKIGRASFWILVLALGNACSNRGSIEQSSAESEACTQAESYPGGTTISGSAQFQRFVDGSAGLTTKSFLPIRWAEVEILNLV
ncbi:MAG: hypothetical protein WCH11_02725, partial [Bdellovibrio sp.]